MNNVDFFILMSLQELLQPLFIACMIGFVILIVAVAINVKAVVKFNKKEK